MTKGLVALNYLVFNCNWYENLDKHLDIIEKELRALEIISRSIVEFSDSKILMGDYYQICIAVDQEECDLLKEVLFDEKEN